jgi:hypothetical protein
VSASGKLADFDSAIPRFESLHPNHFFFPHTAETLLNSIFPFLFFSYSSGGILPYPAHASAPAAAWEPANKRRIKREK